MPSPVRLMRAGDGGGSIDSIIERHSPELMAIPGVLGVGQALCGDSPCIRLYIQDDSVRSRLPASLHGVTVDAVVTGTVTPRRQL